VSEEIKGRPLDGAAFLLANRPFGSTEDAAMSKETPKDDPRQQTDDGSLKQTDKPWKGNPEKEQRSGTKKSDPDRWQETNTH
jgi:hypothetical protein